jgi:hypothetical protein
MWLKIQIEKELFYMLYILIIFVILALLWEIKLKYDEQKASYDDTQTFSNLDELFDYIENSSLPVKAVYRSQNKRFSAEENLIKPLESKYKLKNFIIDINSDYNRYCFTITKKKTVKP